MRGNVNSFCHEILCFIDFIKLTRYDRLNFLNFLVLKNFLFIFKRQLALIRLLNFWWLLFFIQQTNLDSVWIFLLYLWQILNPDVNHFYLWYVRWFILMCFDQPLTDSCLWICLIRSNLRPNFTLNAWIHQTTSPYLEYNALVFIVNERSIHKKTLLIHDLRAHSEIPQIFSFFEHLFFKLFNSSL